MKENARHKKGIKGMRIATGFDFEPLPDGNVLIEFFGGDGKTFNVQVITANVFKHPVRGDPD